jgi:hypothetical protein
MAAELVDVDLLYNDQVSKTVTSRVDPEFRRDMNGLVRDMVTYFGVSGPEYKIRVRRRQADLGTFPTEQQ